MYYNICSKCKSKNVKVITTEINVQTCKCLDCGEIFQLKPNKELAREFNS